MDGMRDGWGKINEPILKVWQASHYVHLSQSILPGQRAGIFSARPRNPGEVLQNPVDTSVLFSGRAGSRAGRVVLIHRVISSHLLPSSGAMDTLALVIRTIPPGASHNCAVDICGGSGRNKGPAGSSAICPTIPGLDHG